MFVFFCSVNSQSDQKEEDKEPVKGENDTDDLDNDEDRDDDDLSDFEEDDEEDSRSKKTNGKLWNYSSCIVLYVNTMDWIIQSYVVCNKHLFIFYTKNKSPMNKLGFDKKLYLISVLMCAYGECFGVIFTPI